MASRNIAERQLSFSTSSYDEENGLAYKKKTLKAPVSTKILEKRRRDRMNNCLADLSMLIPSTYMKKGKSRIEKVDIIEMAITHIMDLRSIITKEQEGLSSSLPDRFLGFKECQDEVMRYLVEVENWDAHDKLCNRMMLHLEQAGEKFRVMNDSSLSQAKKEEIYRTVDDMDSDSFRSIETALKEGGSDPQRPLYTNAAKSSVSQDSQSFIASSKRFCSLPSSQFKRNCMVDDSGVSTDHGSTTSYTVDTRMFGNNGDNLYGSFLVPSSTGNTSGSVASTETGSESSNKLFKLKHRLTKRFSEQITHGINSLSDFSSTSFTECQFPGDPMKRKFRDCDSQSPGSSGSSHLPQSGSSNNNSSSNGKYASSGDEMKSSGYLPGFVLHPSGSHYLPLSIHSSSVSDEISTNLAQQESVSNHPIRIFVKFGGPLIHMQTVVIDSRNISCSDHANVIPATEVVTNSP